MKDLSLATLIAVFEEMFGAWLFWLLVAARPDGERSARCPAAQPATGDSSARAATRISAI